MAALDGEEWEQAIEILKLHASVIQYNPKAKSLHYAVSCGDLTDIKQIIQGGADVDAAEQDDDILRGDDALKDTPLHMAISFSQLESVKLLISLGADVNKMGDSGMTPLLAAVHIRHLTIACELLKSGAIVHLSTKAMRCFPLHLAAASGDVEMIRLLIDHKDLVSRANAYKSLPIHYAARRGHLPAVELLFRRGSLLEHYTEVDEGYTPLLWAYRHNQLEVGKFLMKYSNRFAKTLRRGWSLLHIAAIQGLISIIPELVESGLDVNEKDDEGRTPIYLGIQNGNIGAVELLLKCGADPDLITNGGVPPLALACYTGRVRTCKLLLGHGAKYAQSMIGLDTVSPLTISQTPFFLEREDMIEIFSTVVSNSHKRQLKLAERCWMVIRICDIDAESSLSPVILETYNTFVRTDVWVSEGILKAIEAIHKAIKYDFLKGLKRQHNSVKARVSGSYKMQRLN